MSTGPQRPKVAILGGGAGGLTAAFELTDPARSQQFDVTVYQLGWRLGGKGASGRNAEHGQRIEEHGLHLWFGFYENAFSVMRRCYEELGRQPGTTPLATVDDAFTPCSDIVLYEQWGSRWRDRHFTFPLKPGTPGDGSAAVEFSPESLSQLVISALRQLRQRWDDLSETVLDEAAYRHSPKGPPSGGTLPMWAWPVVPDRDPLALRRWGRAHLLELAELAAAGFLRNLPGFRVNSVIPRLLDAFREWVWEAVVEDRVDDDDIRFAFMVYDFVAGVISGIHRDRLLERGFDVVNDEEFSAWLERHGVTRLTLEHAPFVRGFYSLVFGFEGGDTKRPNVAAGKALEAYFRIAFCYKGAFLYKMRAGMGDVMFAPLYEVLRRRGVKFRFFHPVTRLRLSDDRQTVSSIVVQPQVELAGGGDEYDPLVDVKGLPCWPSEPKWDEIRDGEGLRLDRVDLERDMNPRHLPPRVLERGRDFDFAVLAIPVGALGPICDELATDPTNPRFGRMLANSHTVMTQAFQLWMNQPVHTLGWKHGVDTAMSSYVEPLDTYCDMTQLVDAENWPASSKVASIAYFCGVLPDSVGTTEDEARAAARAYALEYLKRHVGRVWPGAVDATGAFDWDLLVDEAGTSDEKRFAAQYWRANTSGSERYVTTPAGSVPHRLGAHESGYRNLVLAGDWTRNGIDGGCVEAAVTSGMQASRAICGEPAVIPWENGLLTTAPTGRDERLPLASPAAIGRPRFVEFGAVATLPAPYLCESAELYGFLVRADHDRLLALCKKVFEEPTAGAVDYRPFGNQLLLTFGRIQRISPQTPPYDEWGTLHEDQVVLWVPVVGVGDSGALLHARRFAMFVPYIWLTDPLSMATGREAGGWPKSWGWPVFSEPGQPLDLQLDVYGWQFGRENHPERRPLLHITEVSGPNGEDPPTFDNLGALLGALWSTLRDDDGLLIPTPSLALDLLKDAFGAELPELFFKQIRSADDAGTAALQQVVLSAAKIQRLSGRPLFGEYQLEVRDLDSCPVIRELGLRDQRVPMGFKVEMDFVQEPGRVIWEARR
jgi:uncharacterized protein with NAD-binding domain and iron-sulfur cluster